MNMKTTRLLSMKRVIAMLLVLAATITGFTACDTPGTEPGETLPNTDTEAITEGKKEPEKVLITEPITYALKTAMDGVKILGERHLESENMIPCDWTGSGFEVDVDHHGGDIVFTASATADCLFRAYVDGEEWGGSKYAADPELFHVTKSLTTITLKDVPAGERRIKLIKVTGYTIARAQVHDMSFCGTISQYAPEPNELYIEFVGDSICCAWGTIGGHSGTYTDQDGVQLYMGNFMGKPGSPLFRGGVPMIKHGAFCLETQSEPNSVNRGVGIYDKGEVYRHSVVYAVEKL
jgi:hypothetical protein